MRIALPALAITVASLSLSACGPNRGPCLKRGEPYVVMMMVGKIIVPSTRRDCVQWQFPNGRPTP